MKKKLVILVIPFILFGFRDPAAISATDKVKNIFRSTREIKSLTYDFHREERISGQMIKNQSFVKMQRMPYKVYLKELSPNPGIEVLFPHPAEYNKALVNPNGFPWINLKLDATGELMRRNQHHTILDGGYDYVVSVMEYTFYKYRSNISEYIRSNGTTNIDGHTCDIVTMTNPNFKYINYTVKKDETIASIAEKFRLNEYMIFENNENIGFLDDVRAGDVIKVPSDYCARMVLYIDQDREIPLKMEVYDDLGVFERYEFRNVVINPNFKKDEFSDKYKAYRFN